MRLEHQLLFCVSNLMIPRVIRGTWEYKASMEKLALRTESGPATDDVPPARLG